MSSINYLKKVLEKSSTFVASTDPKSKFVKHAEANQYAPGDNGRVRSMMRLSSEARVYQALKNAKDDKLIIDFGKQTENPTEVYSYGFDFWYITPDKNIHTIEVKSSFFDHGAADIKYTKDCPKGFHRPSQFAEFVVVVKISRDLDKWSSDIDCIINNHHYDECCVKGQLGWCIVCPLVNPKGNYNDLVKRQILVPYS